MPFTATPDTMAGAGYTLAAATCDELPACALTPREEREYERLPHAARQRDWLAGRYAAKRAISARWSVPAAEIELSSSPGAAPRPFVRTRSRMGGWSALSDRLTIAHRDGVAIAAAFCSSLSVGVDLERAAEVSPLELRYIVSEPERSGLRGIDATLIWLLKEAAWKALSLPPATPLSSLQVVFRENALVGVRHGTRALTARAAVWPVLAGHPLIAVVVEILPEVS